MSGKIYQVIVYAILTLLGVVALTGAIIWLLSNYGLEAVLIFVVAGTGALWGWVIHWLYKDGRITVSHILVIWIVWTGTIMGGASYYMAYRGIDANLETLSRYIMIELVASIVGYFVKSGLENVKSHQENVKRDL